MIIFANFCQILTNFGQILSNFGQVLTKFGQMLINFVKKTTVNRRNWVILTSEIDSSCKTTYIDKGDSLRDLPDPLKKWFEDLLENLLETALEEEKSPKNPQETPKNPSESPKNPEETLRKASSHGSYENP